MDHFRDLVYVAKEDLVRISYKWDFKNLVQVIFYILGGSLKMCLLSIYTGSNVPAILYIKYTSTGVIMNIALYRHVEGSSNDVQHSVRLSKMYYYM